ncbi:TlpA disulfide reductase family protein [Flagellimonas algicola]|uniref:AhpC/TSA family protein n=1 Tax=Flagellimonas algicola TaxID=2583815 RepID=A0ABY2WNF8_9FLAO|nr:TlpA disulfide reductase family protein [Allomuricauda algicola]TMU56519.1 AhpC/TSA family protein [Allomuricauda algicola]
MRFVFLLLALLALGCSNKTKIKIDPGYEIHGQLTQFKDSTMLLLDDLVLAKTIDSTLVINNAFSLSGKVDEPGRYVLKTKYDPANPDSFKYLFFWIDNSEITIKGNYEDFRYAKVEGSKLHQLAWEFSSARADLDKKREKIVDSLRSNVGDRDELRRQMHEIDSITTAMSIQFVSQKPNNLISLELLTFVNNKFSKSELKKIYDGLDEELKQSTNGLALINYISIDKIVEEGDKMVSMTGENLKGETVDLSQVIPQNEYTILDFWAAGCGPCRLQSKQYAELYTKYREQGLEIVSFSLDKNRKTWEAASNEDNITWINMSDLKGTTGKAPMTYGVRGIPNSFLIDKNGIVIAEFFGYDKDKAPFSDELTAFFDADTNN